MITKQVRLRLTNKMIEVDEKKLADLTSQAQVIQAGLDRLYVRRKKLEADIAMEERDTAPLMKTQPEGVRIDGYQV